MADKDNENKALLEPFLSVTKNSGEVIQLHPNKNNTVQPVALMRLGLFVPTLKSTARGKSGAMASTDATKELKNLTLVKAEGYEKITITGARLDMDNDFKTWAGIIQSFSRYPTKGDTVTLPFIDFVKMCGIPSANSSAALRKRLDASLRRIATNTLSLKATARPIIPTLFSLLITIAKKILCASRPTPSCSNSITSTTRSCFSSVQYPV